MRFFWLLVLITIIAASLHLLFYKGLEIIIILIVIDFMILWTYAELENNKKDREKSILLEKIENLERLMSDLFNKVTRKFSNKKNDKKELIEWLSKF